MGMTFNFTIPKAFGFEAATHRLKQKENIEYSIDYFDKISINLLRINLQIKTPQNVRTSK